MLDYTRLINNAYIAHRTATSDWGKAYWERVIQSLLKASKTLN